MLTIENPQLNSTERYIYTHTHTLHPSELPQLQRFNIKKFPQKKISLSSVYKVYNEAVYIYLHPNTLQYNMSKYKITYHFNSQTTGSAVILHSIF